MLEDVVVVVIDLEMPVDEISSVDIPSLVDESIECGTMMVSTEALGSSAPKMMTLSSRSGVEFRFLNMAANEVGNRFTKDVIVSVLRFV